MNKSVLPNIAPLQKVCIIAHSLGVTTARYYIKNLGGHEHVSHAIFVAGANHGISSCDTVLLTDPEGKIFKQAPELHTGDCEFLNKLNKEPGNEKYVKYMTLTSPHDYYYSIHEDSPFIDWADNRVLPYKGHWSIRDSPESFELMLAFLEGNEKTLKLGKEVIPRPDRVFGEWTLCENYMKDKRFIFTEDGKVKFVNDGKTKEGKYTFCTSYPANLIDLEFADGKMYGLYRLNATGDNLALKFSELNGDRPAKIRYPEIYFKAPEIPLIAQKLQGKWNAIEYGSLKAFAPSEYKISFNASKFKIEGNLIVAPKMVIEGKFVVEEIKKNVYKLHLFIESSNTFLLKQYEYLGGIAELNELNQLLLTIPARSFGSCKLYFIKINLF